MPFSNIFIQNTGFKPNVSTFQRLNVSTFQRFNVSIFQYFNIYSTVQRVTDWYFQFFSCSNFQLQNHTSTKNARPKAVHCICTYMVTASDVSRIFVGFDKVFVFIFKTTVQYILIYMRSSCITCRLLFSKKGLGNLFIQNFSTFFSPGDALFRFLIHLRIKEVKTSYALQVLSSSVFVSAFLSSTLWSIFSRFFRKTQRPLTWILRYP